MYRVHQSGNIDGQICILCTLRTRWLALQLGSAEQSNYEWSVSGVRIIDSDLSAVGTLFSLKTTRAHALICDYTFTSLEGGDYTDYPIS